MADKAEKDSRITLETHKKWNKRILFAALVCLALGVLGVLAVAQFGGDKEGVEKATAARIEMPQRPNCVSVPGNRDIEHDLFSQGCLIGQLQLGDNVEFFHDKKDGKNWCRINDAPQSGKVAEPVRLYSKAGLKLNKKESGYTRFVCAKRDSVTYYFGPGGHIDLHEGHWSLYGAGSFKFEVKY